jgi:hypothetical protein
MPGTKGTVSALHFDINRPIHLARRDAFFERAAELLYQPVAELDATARLEHVSRVLQLLSTAQQHATFATRSAQGPPVRNRTSCISCGWWRAICAPSTP